MSDPALASITETGEELRVGRSKVYELLNSGDLKSIKIGRRHLIIRASIGSYITRLVRAEAI